MKKINADEFIDVEIPKEIRMLFPKHFQSAYDAVNDLVDETPFLKCPPAIMAKGHLVAWAIDFSISQLIESGQWRVDYEWSKYARPTGKYLRIYPPKSILTVSQCQNILEQPRKAIFRANAAFDNQPRLSLFPKEKDFSENGKRPALLLLHGYQKLEFIHIAVPNPARKPAWFGMTNNLLNELRDVSAELTPTEGPETVSAPTIKEHLKKQLRDHAT